MEVKEEEKNLEEKAEEETKEIWGGGRGGEGVCVRWGGRKARGKVESARDAFEYDKSQQLAKVEMMRRMLLRMVMMMMMRRRRTNTKSLRSQADMMGQFQE